MYKNDKTRKDKDEALKAKNRKKQKMMHVNGNTLKYEQTLDDNGRIHSYNDEPSTITKKEKQWHQHGVIHRDLPKPAIDRTNDTQKFYVHGTPVPWILKYLEETNEVIFTYMPVKAVFHSKEYYDYLYKWLKSLKHELPCSTGSFLNVISYLEKVQHKELSEFLTNQYWKANKDRFTKYEW